MAKLIGDRLIARGLATEGEINLALRRQSESSPHKLLGQILIEQGVLSPAQTRQLAGEQESLLLDVVARINSSLDTQSLLMAIMEAVEEMMRVEACSLMLLDRASQELVVMVPTGPARSEIRGTRIPAGQGLCGWVAARGEPLIVADAREDPRFFGEIGTDFRTVDLMCVPLRNPNGEVLGVLEAINKRDGTKFAEIEVPLFMILAHHVAIALEKERLHEEGIGKRLLEQELNWARQIQQGFLRAEMPRYEGIDLAALNVPAKYVSGDYYDVISIDATRCALVIADVSGKGAPAALLMATFRATLIAETGRHSGPEETVARINDLLINDLPPHAFVTLFFGLLDTTTRELTFVNAGHNPPILFDPLSQRIDLLRTGGTIIGFSRSMRFRSERRVMARGQVLVMYTDGVTEAGDTEGEFFGLERLQTVVTGCAAHDARTVLKEIHGAVERFTSGAPQSDDVTLLVMKVD